MSAKLEERNLIMNEMMERCGADVAEAFRQGAISPRLYRECLKRCANCEATEACQRLLAASDASLEEAPDYCENKAEIAELKHRLWLAFN